MSDLTREEIDELFERSKDDRAIIVGSEVRQLAAMALRSLSLREECARICDAYRSWNNADAGWAKACDTLAAAIRASSAAPKQQEVEK